jgi:hypothetical protein
MILPGALRRRGDREALFTPIHSNRRKNTSRPLSAQENSLGCGANVVASPHQHPPPARKALWFYSFRDDEAATEKPLSLLPPLRLNFILMPFLFTGK